MAATFGSSVAKNSTLFYRHEASSGDLEEHEQPGIGLVGTLNEARLAFLVRDARPLPAGQRHREVAAGEYRHVVGAVGLGVGSRKLESRWRGILAT